MISVVVLILGVCGPATARAADLAGVVVSSSGKAWLLRGQEKQPVLVNTKVLAGDVVVTMRAGRVKLSMRDGSIVYVGAHSRIAVQDYSMRMAHLLRGSFRLLWGKARFYVTRLVERGSDFSVKTKTATIGVRGTQFAVIYPKTGLPEGAEIAAPGSIDVEPASTTVLLFEGAVVATNVKGVEHAIKPGTLARVEASGRVFVRPIRKPDVEDLEIEAIAPEAKGEDGAKAGRTEDRKPEAKKPGDRKPEVKESEDTKLETKGPEGKKPGTREPEDGKSRAKVPEVKEPKGQKPEAREFEGRQPEANGPEVKNPDLEEPEVKEPKAAGPKVEEPKVEEPKVRKPKVKEIKVKAPKVEEPKVEAAKVEAPKVEAPKVEAPKVEAPKVEAPKVEAPKVEAPKVEAPKVEAPKVEEPKIETPDVD